MTNRTKEFNKVAVIGGTSDIAQAILQQIPEIMHLYLLGRNQTKLSEVKSKFDNQYTVQNFNQNTSNNSNQNTSNEIKQTSQIKLIKDITVIVGDIISKEGVLENFSKIPKDLDLVIIAIGVLYDSSIHKQECNDINIDNHIGNYIDNHIEQSQVLNNQLIATPTSTTTDTKAEIGTDTDRVLAEKASETIDVNVKAPILWIEQFIQDKINNPTKIKSLSIAIIGSVAGDRARASNYLYGSSKSAIESYVLGVSAYSFLEKIPITLTLVKPGLVDTKMIKNRLDRRMVASPEQVAKRAIKGIRKSKRVVYTPWWWFYIMFFIKLLPFGLFKRIRS